MKRVKRVEHLNIRIVRAQGIVGVGVTTRTSTSSCQVAASRRTDSAGSRADPDSSCRSASSRGCSAGCSWSTLSAAYHAGQLQFFGNQAALADPKAFKNHLAPLRTAEWVVYAKRPFGGPEAVLAYLSRYTHRVAIANSRLVAFNESGVTFKWKDYRAKQQQRSKVMTLAVDEFIRRFLIHVLPSGFHRIRHYGLFANGGRAENIARARQLLNVPAAQPQSHDTAAADDGEPNLSSYPCPCCGGRMIVIETFERGCTPRHHPTQRIRIDSS